MTEKTITLDSPITRGEQHITQITLTKPNAGSLRGTSLSAVLQMDVNALAMVLPRISNPALTSQDVYAMDPADLMQLATEVSSFLLPRSALTDSLTT